MAGAPDLFVTVTEVARVAKVASIITETRGTNTSAIFSQKLAQQAHARYTRCSC